MALLGEISGLSTGSMLFADSCMSLKICVTTWLLEPSTGPAETEPPCILASASGTILYSPEASTTAKPCTRSCDENWPKATSGATGFSVMSVRVPLTRGSTTTLRPVMVAIVRATASISALTKFSVTGSPRRGVGSALLLLAGCATATAHRLTPTHKSTQEAASTRRGRG